MIDPRRTALRHIHWNVDQMTNNFVRIRTREVTAGKLLFCEKNKFLTF